MSWQNLQYVLPVLGAATLCFVLALYARRQSVPGSLPFTWSMLAATEWSLTYALELESRDPATAAFWSNAQYLGSAIAPTAWLLLALQYTGQAKGLTRRSLALLAIVPLITVLLALTNPFHGLILAQISFDPISSLPVETPGVWFWVYTLYSYGLLLASTFLLAQMFRHSLPLYRRQVGALLIGSIAPWFMDALGNSGLAPFDRNIDLTPFGFIVSGVAFAWGLFRFRLLDIMPVARDSIIDTMADGMIVLDGQTRIIDLNPTAQHLIGRDATAVIGQPVTSVWPRVRDLLANSREPVEAHSEISLDGDTTPRYYDVRVVPWSDRRGRVAGSLMSIYDITERKQAEEELQRRADEFAALYETARTFAAEQDLPALLQATVDQATILLRAPEGSIYLYDRTAGDLVRTIGKGAGSPAGLRLKLGEGMAGRVAQTRAPLILDDYRAWEHRSPQFAPLDVSAIVQVPMLFAGELIGVLGVAYTGEAKRTFSEADARLLTLLAGQAASAVHNARLLEEMRARAQQLELLYDAGLTLNRVLEPAEQLELLTRIAMTAVHADRAEFFRFDPARKLLAFEFGVGYDSERIDAMRGIVFPADSEQGLVTWVSRNRLPANLPEVDADPRYVPIDPDMHSGLWVPVEYEGQARGVLVALGKRSNAFTAQDERLLVLFANQISVAMENARLFAQTQQLARTDALTGIANRRQLFEVGERELSRARRFAHPLSVVMLDIDHFKQVNDTYGHAAGDHVLRNLAHCCLKHIRDIDTVGRYGGEEFVILLVETDLAGARSSAERLRERVAQMVSETPQGPVAVTISLGVAGAQEPNEDLTAVLAHADQALYAAKLAGRNRVAVA